MQEVTKLVVAFEDCSRYLWSRGLRDGADGGTIDLFSRLRFDLFREIVLAKIGKADFVRAQPDECFPFIRVAVSEPASVSLTLNQEARAEGRFVWEAPKPLTDVGTLDFRYIEHFAFDQFGPDPLEYCRVAKVGSISLRDQFLLKPQGLRYFADKEA